MTRGFAGRTSSEAIDAARRDFEKTQPVGQQRMAALRANGDLIVFRTSGPASRSSGGGVGTALVGSYVEEVALVRVTA